MARISYEKYFDYRNQIIDAIAANKLDPMNFKIEADNENVSGDSFDCFSVTEIPMRYDHSTAKDAKYHNRFYIYDNLLGQNNNEALKRLIHDEVIRNSDEYVDNRDNYRSKVEDILSDHLGDGYDIDLLQDIVSLMCEI